MCRGSQHFCFKVCRSRINNKGNTQNFQSWKAVDSDVLFSRKPSKTWASFCGEQIACWFPGSSPPPPPYRPLVSCKLPGREVQLLTRASFFCRRSYFISLKLFFNRVPKDMRIRTLFFKAFWGNSYCSFQVTTKFFSTFPSGNVGKKGFNDFGSWAGNGFLSPEVISLSWHKRTLYVFIYQLPHMISLIEAPPQLALPHHMTKYTYAFDHFNILMLALCPSFWLIWLV